ncbi:MAG: hypothetical protein GC206_14720 [Alphaproteobacteria bacterium]|nr:hypothetical protein [Alphaproteobacteria bacterium]
MARPKAGGARAGLIYLMVVLAGVLAFGVYLLVAQRGLATRVSAIELARCAQTFRFAAEIQAQGAQGDPVLERYLAAVEDAGFARARAEADMATFNEAFAARAQREGLDFRQVIREAIEEDGQADTMGEPGPLIERLRACEALREDKSWLQTWLGR